VRRADNLTTFTCRLSGNLGASSSWNPEGLSRPVQGLLYLFFYYCTHGQCNTWLHYTRIYSTYLRNVYTWSYVLNFRNPCSTNFPVTVGNLGLFTSKYRDSTAVVYKCIIINQHRALRWISSSLNPSTGTQHKTKTYPLAVLFTNSVTLYAGRGKDVKSETFEAWSKSINTNP